MTKQVLSDDFEALVLALELAITAPDESMSKKLSDMAEQLAGYMQVSEVELATQIALSNVMEGCQ